MCKEDYFKVYFESNKIDPKKIWYSIKTITSTKTSEKGYYNLTLNFDIKTKSGSRITKELNGLFTSITGKLIKKFSTKFSNFF